MSEKKQYLTALLSMFVLVMLVASFFYFYSPVFISNENSGLKVEGGIIIRNTTNEIIARCLGPQTTLHLGNFEGKVIFTNCFENFTLQGVDNQPQGHNNNFSVDVNSKNKELRITAEQKTDFRFAVIGDSQGMNYVLKAALESMNGCEFVIHCGDVTPSGSQNEYSAVIETLNSSSIPVFTTPGNHDVKNNGTAIYNSLLSPQHYSFEYGGVVFVFIDSSGLSISTSEFDWARGAFANASIGSKRVLITHAPSYDPDGENHTLDVNSCASLKNFVKTENVSLVLTGHIHEFNHTKIGSTDFIITGGGGGTLRSGSHHYVCVDYSGGAFAYSVVEINTVSTGNDFSIAGKDRTVNVSISDLLSMSTVEGNSSYQNQLGNFADTGNYKGVLVRDLVYLVGGMSENNTLTIEASDSYIQEYGYRNVYTNETYQQVQGDMILAIEYKGLKVPAWPDGPRIAMLPEDGIYNNSNCKTTSYPNQGYNTYPSAGARWIKNVVKITVE